MVRNYNGVRIVIVTIHEIKKVIYEIKIRSHAITESG